MPRSHWVPLLRIDGHGQQQWRASHVHHAATLPDRSGRQMIYAVWEIADAANAFHQCIDVNFGETPLGRFGIAL